MIKCRSMTKNSKLYLQNFKLFFLEGRCDIASEEGSGKERIDTSDSI